MPTTFQVIYLGNLTDIDSREGNYVAESAKKLVGLEFGDKNHPISDSSATWSQVGGPDSTYDMNNFKDADQFSINGGPAQTFDGTSVYNATLTYVDGTTATITAVIAQDVNGETYLAPEYSENADQAALDHDVIQSISLDSLAGNRFSGMTASRENKPLVTCFVAGTRIRAEMGAVAIEHLKVGDRVVTLDHGLQPIRWIGRSHVAADPALAPIRFAPGAFGNTRPLLVSPQHRMLVQGGALELCHGAAQALLPACHMINGQDITQIAPAPHTYLHLMFDQHELIWAEGALCESFFPGDMGMAALSPAARAEITAIFPDLHAHGAPGIGPMARSQIRPEVWTALQ